MTTNVNTKAAPAKPATVDLSSEEAQRVLDEYFGQQFDRSANAGEAVRHRFEMRRLGDKAIYGHGCNVPGLPIANFLDFVQRIADGAKVVRNLTYYEEVNRQAVENEQEDDALIGLGDADQLEELVHTAIELLGDRARNLQRWMYERWTPEGNAKGDRS